MEDRSNTRSRTSDNKNRFFIFKEEEKYFKDDNLTYIKIISILESLEWYYNI